MPRLNTAAAALIITLALAGGAHAAPTATPWPVYFTDNLEATAPSDAPTVMEQALLDALGGASATIDAALYDFNRASIRDALLAAHARGVSVRVVADDETRASVGQAPFYDALAAAGIPIVTDAPGGSGLVDWWTGGLAGWGARYQTPDALLESRLMHNKYFIIDGQRVWTGSANMSNTDFTLNHNNAMLVDSAELAARFQADFDQMAAGIFGTDKSPSVTTTLTISGVTAGVYFSPQDNPIAPIVAEVNAAQQSIDFAIFFFTNDALRDALLAAHARGVAIRGLWDSLGAGDDSADDEALCAAGIPLKVETTRGILHHKLMVIDAQGADPRVVAGSLNWTATATTANNENTLILRDRDLAAAYSAEFARMWDFFPQLLACNRVYLPLVIDDTPALPPPPVLVARIVYNPPGDDLAGELVELALSPSGPASVDLAGWTLRDAANNPNVYTFPPGSAITPAAPLRVWVKAGADTATDLFWGRAQPVWSNDGDTAILRDAEGQEVNRCGYAGGGEEALCF